MTDNPELEDFAERVRLKAAAIMSAAVKERHRLALELAAEMYTQANAVVQQQQMAREAASENRYDLAALPSQSNARKIHEEDVSD